MLPWIIEFVCYKSTANSNNATLSLDVKLLKSNHDEATIFQIMQMAWTLLVFSFENFTG